MLVDILKNIIDISNDKKDTLLYFLDDDIRDKVKKYRLIDSNELYLNDSLICIDKSNLQIEYTGKIIYIQNNIIRLNINNHGVNINPNNYYKFIKRKKNINDNRIFFQELLN